MRQVDKGWACLERLVVVPVSSSENHLFDSFSHIFWPTHDFGVYNSQSPSNSLDINLLPEVWVFN